MKLPLCKLISIFTLVFLFAGFAFAQTDSEKAIELYKKGDFQGTILRLKNSEEVKDLYYLGLAYEKSNEIGKAKDAFKKSFAKSYDFFFKRFNEWQKIYNDESKQSFSNLLQEIKANNLIGLSAAEKAFVLKSEIFQINEWRIKAKILSDTMALAKTQEEIYSVSNKAISSKAISSVQIVEKPRVAYPKDNRGIPLSRANASPNKSIVVTLFVVYGADGQIKLVMPTEEVFDAFTVEGLKAAGNIKFKPAIKDNKPVTYRTKIQYSFSSR